MDADREMNRMMSQRTLRFRAALRILFASPVLAFGLSVGAIAQELVVVNFSRTNGVFRALHGVNKGPLVPGGLIDLTESHRALGIPFTRLHDCHWPNPDVVDIHTVFPDFDADPEDPAGYDFRMTDEYVSAVRATGSRLIYRLGESIEHTAVKRFVHPPRDAGKWAAICLGIIRHYNQGWAGGFDHDIRYWEIWNEPENRPAMWTGTDEDYLRLYATAARAIKEQHPELKVGGPAVGSTGELVEGAFRPSGFVTNFLGLCRREGLPLDFFSWHCYTDNPDELVERARGIRSVLDQHGFGTTESHLTEWNHLPGKSWEPALRTAAPEARQEFYEAMAGVPGAAFVAAALLSLQDAPVDVCALFHGGTGGFGLFNESGVASKNYHAMRAFRELLDTTHRAGVSTVAPPGMRVGAGLNPEGTEARVLVSHYSDRMVDLEVLCGGLPWRGGGRLELLLLDMENDLVPVIQQADDVPGASVRIALDGPAVLLIRLRQVQ
jgi:hypothetical protein